MYMIVCCRELYVQTQYLKTITSMKSERDSIEFGEIYFIKSKVEGIT